MYAKEKNAGSKPGRASLRLPEGSPCFRFPGPVELLAWLNDLPIGLDEARVLGEAAAWRRPADDSCWLAAAALPPGGGIVEERRRKTTSPAPEDLYAWGPVGALARAVRPRRVRGPAAFAEARRALFSDVMDAAFDGLVRVLPDMASAGDAAREEGELRRAATLVTDAALRLKDRLFVRYLLWVPRESVRGDLEYLNSLGFREVRGRPLSAGDGRPGWLLSLFGRDGRAPLPPRGGRLYYFLGGDGRRDVYLEFGWAHVRGWWRWLAPEDEGLLLLPGEEPREELFMTGSPRHFQVLSAFGPISFGRPAGRDPVRLVARDPGPASVPVTLTLERGKSGVEDEALRLEKHVRHTRLRLNHLEHRLELLRPLQAREDDGASSLWLSIHDEGGRAFEELVRDSSPGFLRGVGHFFLETPLLSGEIRREHVLVPGRFIAGGPAPGPSPRPGADLGRAARFGGGRTYSVEPRWLAAGIRLFAPDPWCLHPRILFDAKNAENALLRLGPLLSRPEEADDRAEWAARDWARFAAEHLFLLRIVEYEPRGDAKRRDDRVLEIVRIPVAGIRSLASGLRFYAELRAGRSRGGKQP